MKMIAGAILILAAVSLYGAVLADDHYGRMSPVYSLTSFSANLGIPDVGKLVALGLGLLGSLWFIWGTWEDRFRRRD
jgi:hypothetical protein